MAAKAAVDAIPHVPYLSASRSKREFFQRLSLSETNDGHVALYDLMKVWNYPLLQRKIANKYRKKQLLAETVLARTRVT